MFKNFLFRALAFLLALTVFFSLIPFVLSVENDGGKCGEKLYWAFDASSKTLRIYGEGKMYNYKHYSSADCRSPWCDFRSSVRTLIIEEGCTEIGEYAFIGNGISKIVFPESSLKKIGQYAFYMNNRLNELEIPDGVTYIGEYAFGQCRYVTSLKLGSGLKKIPRNAFCYMERLTDVILSPDTKRICTQAFFNCISLKSIDLSSIEVIDPYAFSYCTALTEVKLGENLRELGVCAFNYCTSLSNIDLCSYPEKFSSSYDAYTAHYDNLPRGPYTLCDGKILCNKGRFEGEAIVIPDGVELIADSCFANAYYFTKLVIPASVKVIGSKAFFNSRSLTDVYIPDTVEKIGDMNFGYMQEGTHDYFIDTVRIHGKYGGAGYKYAMENGLCFVCEHEFKEVNKASDCTQGGYIYEACACGYVYKRTRVDAAEHKPTTVVKKETCTSKGSVTVSCEVCGTVLSQEIIPEKSHDVSGGYTLGSLPTCEEPGYLVLVCKNCGEEVSRRTIEKHGHSNEIEYITITEATCLAEGCRNAVCPDCGKTVESSLIPKKEHTPETEWTNVTVSSGEYNIPGLKVKLCRECKNAAEYMWYMGEDTPEKLYFSEATALIYPVLTRITSGDGDCGESDECVDFNSDGRVSSRDIVAFKKITGES